MPASSIRDLVIPPLEDQEAEREEPPHPHPDLGQVAQLSAADPTDDDGDDQDEQDPLHTGTIVPTLRSPAGTSGPVGSLFAFRPIERSA